MSKYIFILFFSAFTVYAQVINASNLIGNTSNNLVVNETDSLRKCFYNAGIGLFQYLSLGIGGQIDEKFSAMILFGFSWNRGNGYIVPGTGSGIGIKVNYHNKFGFFDKISSEYIYYLNSSYISYENQLIVPKGNYFELTIGSENIQKEKLGTFNLFWEAGIGISTIQHKKSLILPTLKIGISKYIF